MFAFGCRQASPIDFVPKNALLVGATDVEQAYLTNTRLDKNLEQGIRADWKNLLHSASTFTRPDLRIQGRMYFFALADQPGTLFFSYCGRASTNHLRQVLKPVLEQLTKSEKGKAITITGRPTSYPNLHLAALCPSNGLQKARQTLDRLAISTGHNARPLLHLVDRQRKEALQLYIPSLDALTTDSVASHPLLKGSLYIGASINRSLAQLTFDFVPGPGNPMQKAPWFTNGLAFIPEHGLTTDGNTLTHLAVSLNKKALLAWLPTDRHFRLARTLLQVARVPLDELLAATGGQLYLNAYKKAGGTGTLQATLGMDVASRPQVQKSLGRMVRNRLLTSNGHGFTAGKTGLTLVGNGEHLLFHYKTDVAPIRFTSNNHLALQAYISGAVVKQIVGLTGQQRNPWLEPVLQATGGLTCSAEAQPNGALTGQMVLEHHINMFSLADRLD